MYLLARWLPTTQYGSFNVAFTVYLIITTFHSSLILEPMSVLGPSQYFSKLRFYTKLNIWLHIVFTGFITLLTLVILIIFRGIDANLKNALFGMALFSPFLLFFWFYRQICYIKMQPKRSFQGSVLYAALMAFGLAFIKLSNLVNPFWAFLIMAIASFIVPLILWPDRETLNLFSVSETIEALRQMLFSQWTYGRWSFGTAIAMSFSTNIYPVFIGLFLGLSEAGLFRATQNLILPLQQIIAASSILLVPIMVRERENRGRGNFEQRSNLIIFIFISISSLYILLLMLFKKEILHFIYNSYYYEQNEWMILHWAVIAILIAVITSLIIRLKAMQKPRIIFISYFVSAIFTVMVGRILITSWHLNGAMISMEGSYTIMLIVILISMFIEKNYSLRTGL